MKIMKSISFMMLLLAFGAAVVWSAGTVEGSNTKEQQETYVIRLGHNVPADPINSMTHAGAVAFKEAVERKTNGRVDVQIYPAAQLGDQRVLIESLQMGTVEMAITGDAPIVNWYKPFGVIGLPYAFKNSQIAYEVLDGDFGKELSDELADATGIRVLAYGENGFRHLTNNSHEVRTPADISGLKIRIQENPAHIKMIAAMGGIPTPMGFAEVYTSLQQGVLDGQENPLSVITSAKLYEVQEYLTLDGHLWSAAMLQIGEEYLRSLPSDIQNAIIESSVDFNTAVRNVTNRLSDEGISELKGYGMQVYQPTFEELQLFASVAQPSVIEFLKSEGVGDWVNKLLNSIAIVEK